PDHSLTLFLLIYYSATAHHRALHSFPTRRSSDLDLAVAVCGDAHFYATALLSMERLRVTPPAFVLAAAGRGGTLMGRIRPMRVRSEEHTSELQSRFDLVCRLLLEKKKIQLILKYK